MYNKPVTTIAQQIQQLKDRGLLIADDSTAHHFLSNISYYRLAGYWWPMQSDKINHTFKSDSKFEDVIALYNFDRELRILLFDVIERIEIGLRTRMIYHLAHVPPVQEHHKLYIHTCCLKYLLDVVSPGHQYKTNLADLFVKYPNVDLSALGFTPQWLQEPLWA